MSDETPKAIQPLDQQRLINDSQGKTINIVLNWNGKTLIQFTVSGVTLAAILFVLKTVFDMFVVMHDHNNEHH